MYDLSDPPPRVIDPEKLCELRVRAATQLRGAAAAKGAMARATDVLTVLHELASSPETASDALTLLHELQVYQVELEIQAQELRESRAELESALRRQIELYDGQPVGCYTIGPHSALHELNQTGAEMLGIGRPDAVGMSLDAFLGAESALRFRAAIASLDAGRSRASCRLTLCPKDGPERPVLASIGKDPAAGRYLVSWADAGDDAAPRPAAT